MYTKEDADIIRFANDIRDELRNRFKIRPDIKIEHELIDTKLGKEHGIIISDPKHELQFVAYVSDYYKDGDPAPMEEICNDIVSRFYERRMISKETIEKFKDWNYAKHYLEACIFSPENMHKVVNNRLANKQIDDTDLCIIFLLKISDKPRFEYIYRDLMDTWGVTIDDIYDAWLEDAPKKHPAKIINIDNAWEPPKVMQDIMTNAINDTIKEFKDNGSNIFDDNTEHRFEDPTAEQVFIVSTKDRCNGATVILYPEVQKELDELFGVYGYYLIPASVHEFLAMSGACYPDELLSWAEGAYKLSSRWGYELTKNVYLQTDGVLKQVFTGAENDN